MADLQVAGSSKVSAVVGLSLAIVPLAMLGALVVVGLVLRATQGSATFGVRK